MKKHVCLCIHARFSAVVIGVAILLSATANASFLDEPAKKENHVLGKEAPKGEAQAGNVKTFTNLYSRANDDTRQNASAGGGGLAGDPFEVTLLRCQLKAETSPDGSVKASFNWNAQMTTGRHLKESDSYEMRWIRDEFDKTKGETDPKFRQPDDKDLTDSGRQSKLFTRWREEAHKDGDEATQRGSSMTTKTYVLGVAQKQAGEQVIKGELEIRFNKKVVDHGGLLGKKGALVDGWRILDAQYKRTTSPEYKKMFPDREYQGFAGGVFQKIKYEMKVVDGKVVSGDVHCGRPKNPDFKLFLSNYRKSDKGKDISEFDPDTYDDVRFDYCRAANADAAYKKKAQEKAKAEGKTLSADELAMIGAPAYEKKITHQFPPEKQPTKEDCEKWTKTTLDQDRRYRDQPPGANCEVETVGSGNREDEEKLRYVVPADTEPTERKKLELAKVLKVAGCASCHGKNPRSIKGKTSGYRVCNSGNWKDGTPLFLGDMLNFIGPLIFEGKSPHREGGYPDGMQDGLNEMMKEFLKMGAKGDELKTAVKTWDDFTDARDRFKEVREASGANPSDEQKAELKDLQGKIDTSMKALKTSLTPARELFCQQANHAGINGEPEVREWCKSTIFYRPPAELEKRLWARGLERPSFAQVLESVERGMIERQWKAMVRALAEKQFYETPL